MTEKLRYEMACKAMKDHKMQNKTALEIYQEHQSPVSKVAKKTGPELFEDYEAKKKKKKPKMRNNPVIIDNIWFQSEGEGHYYLFLKSDYQKGKMQGFKRQISFPFYVNGVLIGSYRADFGVLNHDGTLEIIDYKSRFTVSLSLYVLKRQLMLACYQVAIKEVGAK